MSHVVDPDIRPLYAKIYMALREYWLLTGYGPSKNELMRATGVSMTTIIYAIRELRSRGYVTAPKHQIRAMKPTDLDRTLSATPPDPWADLDTETGHFWEFDT